MQHIRDSCSVDQYYSIDVHEYLLTPEFADTALLLAGCSSSSPMMPSIFLMSLWYDKTSPEYNGAQVDPSTSRAIANIAGDAEMEARVGYA